ncbi:putative inactive purple acid phosphatase 28 [Capsicum baccatum]|uniref:Inactive purple acid phosphatase 28 n=1 Tax=Capsicum baccatum TaxID=33114 RepID=A0A2G2VSX4_CAPBA|nr:putative inactive purple acid phosphatase 28 [Capsicum baccatum]
MISMGKMLLRKEWVVEQRQNLEAVLPPKPKQQVSGIKLDEYEETTVHDVNIEDEMHRKQQAAQEVANMHYGNGMATRDRYVLESEFNYCTNLNTTQFLRKIIDIEKPDLIVFTAVGMRFGSQTAPAIAAPAKEAVKLSDDDIDLFGEETKDEKKAEEAKEATNASTKKKESGKSSVLMDFTPWDDETKET